MEYSISYNLPLLFSLSLFIILVLKLASNKSRHTLPPGPRQLPVIGSVHHLVGSELPHHRFRRLSKTHGPLMHLRLGEVSMVVASSPEVAREIMKTHDLTFASRPLFPAMDLMSYGGKSLTFGIYGEHWRQLRRICVLELLSAKRVRSFRLIREQECQSLACSIYSSSRNGCVVNLSQMLVQLANDITLKAVVGEKCSNDMQKLMIQGLNEAVAIAAGFDPSDLFPSWSRWARLVSPARSKAEKAFQKQDYVASCVLNEHREKKMMTNKGEDGAAAEDLVDVVLRLQEEGKLPCELTDDSIKALILDMFGAGSETSSTLLLWVMSELINNPRVMKKAQIEMRDSFGGKCEITEDDIKDLSYMHLIIRETLRLHPPVPLLIPRECQENCKVLGYDIPAKARVAINVWAIGRDPTHWEDAEEFKPERFEGSEIDFRGTNFELLPFGAGRRMCPGMLFGLAAVEVPLAHLLYYFDWELPTGGGGSGSIKKSLDMSEAFGITSRRQYDLILRAIPRVPLSP